MYELNSILTFKIEKNFNKIEICDKRKKIDTVLGSFSLRMSMSQICNSNLGYHRYNSDDL